MPLPSGDAINVSILSASAGGEYFTDQSHHSCSMQFHASLPMRVVRPITLEKCRLYGLDDIAQETNATLRGDRFIVRVNGMLNIPYLFVNCTASFAYQNESRICPQNWELFGMTSESVHVAYSMLVNQKVKRVLMSAMNYER